MMKQNLRKPEKPCLICSDKPFVLSSSIVWIRPEFINRVDEIIMFRPLSEKQIREIAELQGNIIKEMLAKNGIRLTLTDAAINWIARAGFDPQYGARPVKRVIQKHLMLSKMILAGKVNREDAIVVDANEQGLIFSN